MSNSAIASATRLTTTEMGAAVVQALLGAFSREEISGDGDRKSFVCRMLDDAIGRGAIDVDTHDDLHAVFMCL